MAKYYEFAVANEEEKKELGGKDFEKFRNCPRAFKPFKMLSAKGRDRKSKKGERILFALPASPTKFKCIGDHAEPTQAAEWGRHSSIVFPIRKKAIPCAHLSERAGASS